VLSRRAIVGLLNLLDGESITVFDDDLDRVAERLNDAALRDRIGTDAA
jgi:hypothetical protein